MMKYLVMLALPLLVVAQPIEIDTIGGTTYDWAANGPTWRMVVNDPAYGIHVTWMYSADPGNSWPDRSMRYNFYDNGAGAWNFVDPANYMNSGVNVFTDRNGYGSLDVNPATGCGYISAHRGVTGDMTPMVARDAAPGAGIFEVCDGAPDAYGYQWPDISMGPNEKIHVGCLDMGSQDMLYYTSVNPWCTWATPIDFTDNEPLFPDHYIAASKTSEKVLHTWINTASLPYTFHYRYSSDGGANWDPEVLFDPPPAYTPGSETIPSYHLAGNSILWDNNDDYHLTVLVMSVVNGTGYIIPCEIWHYCPANTPAWSKVIRASCDTLNLGAGVGYNVLYAGRPSVGIDANNNLFCVWEQFDSSNVEPATNFLRAVIMASASNDNGQTWGPPIQLTSTDETSHRFPTIARVVDDYVHIVCEQDLQAGFWVQAEGNSTNNPYLYLKVPKTLFPNISVAENPTPRVFASRLSVAPNPFENSTRVSYELHRAGSAALRIYDASGHLVKTLVSGNLPAGRGSATWTGLNELGNRVAGGIYFARLESSDRVLNQKLVLTR
jgi:hypothetical protein